MRIDHNQYPQRVIYGSENSKSFEAWKAVEDHPYISGQFLWTAFDFMGEARSWPVRSSGAGLIDLAGFPKPEYYHRKSLWSDEPVVFLAAAPRIKTPQGQRRFQRRESHWNWHNGDSVWVECYTNAEEAVLFLNGRSQGKKKLSESRGRILRWPLRYEKGELVVKAYKAGREMGEYTIKTTGAPARVTIASDRTVISADNQDVAHVEITVVDQQGARVGHADDEVTLNIAGPGKLIGMESGSLDSHEDYKSNRRKAVRGKLVAYIQAVKPGQIKVTVQSPNLQSDNLIIHAK